jgi:hypothetical protein
MEKEMSYQDYVDLYSRIDKDLLIHMNIAKDRCIRELKNDLEGRDKKLKEDMPYVSWLPGANPL